MSDSEMILYRELRNRGMRFKFRRQHPIGKYVLDFYCAESKLCVEVDGEQHIFRKEHDRERDGYLDALGIATLRIDSMDLFTRLDGVLDDIWQACSARAPAWQ